MNVKFQDKQRFMYLSKLEPLTLKLYPDRGGKNVVRHYIQTHSCLLLEGPEHRQ